VPESKFTGKGQTIYVQNILRTIHHDFGGHAFAGLVVWRALVEDGCHRLDHSEGVKPSIIGMSLGGREAD